MGMYGKEKRIQRPSCLPTMGYRKSALFADASNGGKVIDLYFE